MSQEWPTVLYFGNDWSADNRTSSHHMARRLMKNGRVIYIECPGLRSPQGSSRDIKKVFSKLFKGLRGPRRLENGSYVYTLLQIPFHRFAFVRAVNRHLIVWLLKCVCWILNVKRPVLWFVLPHLAMVPGRLNESLSVYYCIDDYANMPGVNQEMIRGMDEELCCRCDLVFVSSEPLLESKKRFGPKVHLSLHGVDFDHFNRAEREPGDAAEEVKDLPGKVVGFFGLIEEWIDLDLVKYTAESRPDWTLLMIGRVAVRDNPCEGLKNVRFIGARSYEDLPRYAARFDAAIIPVKINDLIINFNPLKLREYLAMGRPVVSTRFPEVEKFGDIVGIADTREEFVAALDAEMTNDSPEKHRLRAERVRPLSWDSRFQEVLSLARQTLEQKKQG